MGWHEFLVNEFIICSGLEFPPYVCKLTYILFLPRNRMASYYMEMATIEAVVDAVKTLSVY